MTLSSGERPRGGGRILLYRARNQDLTEWGYLGVLFSATGNSTYSPFSGKYGFNFEVAGYHSIASENDILHFVIFGSEGGRNLPNGSASHWNHWPLFTAGSVTPEATLDVTMSGVLDWGTTYAYLGVEDPVGKRRLIWGWIYEDDNEYGAAAKGWQGSLGLPRVLSVNLIREVTDSREKVMEKGYWDFSEEGDGKYTIRVCHCIYFSLTCGRLLDKPPYRNFPAFEVLQITSYCRRGHSVQKGTKWRIHPDPRITSSWFHCR